MNASELMPLATVVVVLLSLACAGFALFQAAVNFRKASASRVWREGLLRVAEVGERSVANAPGGHKAARLSAQPVHAPVAQQPLVEVVAELKEQVVEVLERDLVIEHLAPEATLDRVATIFEKKLETV